MRRIRSAFLAAAFLALVAACDRQPAPDVPSATPGTSAPAGGTAVTGTVLETMDSGGYTYLKLKTARGEVWAAVPQAAVQVGQRVALGGDVVAIWKRRVAAHREWRLRQRFDFAGLGCEHRFWFRHCHVGLLSS